MTEVDLVRTYVRWTGMRAFLHNGWWLVTSVYLVLDAGLTPSQLVLIGVGQGVIALIFEVPAGVLADAFSRKWSLVLSHGLMGLAMLSTGLVTSFPALLATQMLWGLSWTFASGADVAWVTDELNEPRTISSVLTRAARWQLLGSAAGMLGVGLLATVTQRGTAMVLAGTAMLLLGTYVVVRFPETNFVPATSNRWRTSMALLSGGLLLVRRSRVILLIFGATFIINGASDAFARLHTAQLLDTGFPVKPDPMLWLTGLGIAALLLGAAALQMVERRIDGLGVARSGYIAASGLGGVGLLMLAFSPNAAMGSAAVLLVAGVAIPLTRTIGTIWVNRQTTDDVRATVHSLLAQAEYLGEILCGLAIGLLAHATNLPLALVGCASLFALTAALVTRAHDERTPLKGTAAGL